MWHLLGQNIYRDGSARNLEDLRWKLDEAVLQFNNELVAGKNIYDSFSKRIFQCYELSGGLVKS